jgi:hypothetical protein
MIRRLTAVVFSLIAVAISPEVVGAQCSGVFQLLLEQKYYPINNKTVDVRIRPCWCISYSFDYAPLPPHLQNASFAMDAAIDQWKAEQASIKVTRGSSTGCVDNGTVTFVMGTPVNGAWPFGSTDRGVTNGLGDAQFTDGYLTGFHTYFNMDSLGTSPPARWTLGSNPPTGFNPFQSPPGRIHFPTAALHEAGHIVGLDHLEVAYAQSNPSCPTVMYPWSGTLRTSLQQWDKAALSQLYSTDVCGLWVPSTWGTIKGLYRGGTAFTQAVALTGEHNTLVWKNLSNPASRRYFVFRSVGGDDTVDLLGTVSGGDSIFVDSTTAFGERYDYHIAAADGETLLEVGTPRAGLKLIKDHIFDDAIMTGVYSDADLAVRGSILYATLNVSSGSYQIRKYNVSNPLSISELGRRSGLDGPVAICLSEDGTKLYVQTYTSFAVINASQNTMPLLDEIPNIVSGSGATGDQMADMAVTDDIVYLACGVKGIKAISVDNPSNIRLVGTFDPDGAANGKTIWDLQMNGSALYASERNLNDGSSSRCDRLAVTKQYSFGLISTVTFSVECTSDDPTCWEGFSAGTSMVGRIQDGPFELQLEPSSAHPYVVVNTRDQNKPSIIRSVDAPAVGPAWVIRDTLGTPIDTVSFFSTFESYDFDSRFLYATTPMFHDPFDRELVAFDTWGEGIDALYTGGDMLGTCLAGTVRSQGKYLYVLDDFLSPAWTQHKPRLRIYQKATGCQPDPVHPVRVFPESDAHKQGESVGISLAIGCPSSVHVEFLEDGNVVSQVSTLNFAVADDIAHALTWPISYSTTHFENHSYSFRATATYPDNSTSVFMSDPFRIEIGDTREVAIGGGKPFTSIQSAINASASGDEIVVYSGNYTEQLTLKSNVRIIGKPGASIIAGANGPAVSGTSLFYPATLDGFEFHSLAGTTTGAISITGCGIIVKNCTFNSLTRAVNISGGHATFTSCIFANDQHLEFGGAVWLDADAVQQTSFTDCQFTNNSAGTRGGAVYIGGTGAYSATTPQPTFVRCLFSGNSAPEAAAVRVGVNRRPNFDHCVFSSNHPSATSGGSIVGGAAGVVGGINSGASATFTNCTFASNSAAQSYDVVRLEPAGTVPLPTISSTIFANNSGGNALGQYGGTYGVMNSDFYGNSVGDATWAAGGTGNFSANPAFCPSGNYSIQAYSPCAAGVTASTLVGAKEIGCRPSAGVSVLAAATLPPDNLIYGCPKGDADVLSIQVDFDNSLTRNVQANEVSIAAPYLPLGVFATTTIRADTPANAPNYIMTLNHEFLSSYGDDSVTVYLNGYPLANKAFVRRRGPDMKSAGPEPKPCGGDMLCPDGRVSIADFNYFTTHYPSGAYVPQCDFNGSGAPINLGDFGLFCVHFQNPEHHLPFSGPLLSPAANAQPQVAVTSGHVAMSFTDEYVTALSRHLSVDLSLESFQGISLCLFAVRTNRSDLALASFEPTSWGSDHVIFTTVDRGGQTDYYFGVIMKDDFDDATRHLGALVFNVQGSSPITIADDEFVISVGEAQLGEDSQANYAIMSGVLDGGIGRTLAPTVQRVFHNRLEQNFPNPFNPQTTIAFSLKQAKDVRLTIYDVTGGRVKDLMNERRPAGAYQIVWDGTNNSGSQVASGVYFCKLSAGSFVDTKKLVMLK